MAHGPEDTAEQELLALAQRGDANALAALLKRNEGTVRRVAAQRRRLVEPDDLVQQVNLKMLVYQDKGHVAATVDSFRALLATAARRITIDLWRSHKRHPTLPSDQQDALPALQGNPEDEAASRATAARVAASIKLYVQTLPPDRQEILRLHVEERLGLPSIMRQLSLGNGPVTSEYTVKTILHTYRKALMSALTEPDGVSVKPEPKGAEDAAPDDEGLNVAGRNHA